MKQFRKTKDDLFICEICGEICKSFKSLGCHLIKQHNIKSKEYYDKWIKQKEDGRCVICGASTTYYNLNFGYTKYCSKKCSRNSSEVQEKEKQTNLKLYGVEYYSQDKEKRKITQKKIENTKKKRYGNKNYNNSEKNKQTCLKRYGVEHTHQNIKIFEKSQKTRFLRKQYKDTDLWYQGSYELDFLEKYYDKIKIQRAPSIKYKHERKNKVYHPDFFIPSKNLIVECKNLYLYERYKKIINNQKGAVINKNYNYIIIINKNYNKFNLYLL